MNPYASITTPELESLKTGYLNDLSNPRIPPVLRGTIQTELSQIDAALKEQNIAAAASQQKTQNPRSDLPAATERSGIQPSSRGSLPAATAAVSTSIARPALKPPWPKGVHSRGEFILMRAEQLQSQIRKVSKIALPHTLDIVPQLDAFIAAQRVLVADERVVRQGGQLNPRSDLPAATTMHLPHGPDQWSETWKDQTSGSDPVASAWPKGWPRTVSDTQASTPCPVCGPEREVCFIKRDGIRCVVLGQMGPSRWHPSPDGIP